MTFVDSEQIFLDSVHLALAKRTEMDAYHQRMSSAGRCVRARYYHAIEAEPTNETTWKSQLAMARGEDIERLALALLKEGGIDVHSEQIELETDGRTGHPDGLIGTGGGVDVKGTNAVGWGLLKRNGPHLTNIYQCQMYMHATGRKWWLLMYVNRDGYPADEFPIMFFLINYDPFMAEEAIANYVRVATATEQGIPPDRPYSRPKEFPCAFCPWSDRCWEDYSDEFAGRKGDVVEIDDAHVNDVCVQYLEVKAEHDRLADLVKELKDKIQTAMDEHNARRATTRDVKVSTWITKKDYTSASKLAKHCTTKQVEDATSSTTFQNLRVWRK